MDYLIIKDKPTIGDAIHAAKSGFSQFLVVLGQALLVFYQLAVSRLYGAATYGVYMASAGIIEVLSRGGQFGADKAMLRFIAKHRIKGEFDLAERALGTGLRLSAMVSAFLALALIGVAGWIARLQHKPELSTMLRVMAPAVVFTAAMMVLVEAMLGAKKPRMNLVVRGLSEPGFLLLFAIIGAVLFGGPRTIALAHLLATACTVTIAALAASKVFGVHQILAGLRAKAHPEVARFSFPVAASEMMNAILQRADVVLLGFFVSREQIGIYAAAEFIGRAIAGARYAFDSVACPVISEALTLHDQRRLQYNLALMTRWVATIAAYACCVLISLRADLLPLFGHEFTKGAVSLIILAAAHFINGTFGLTPWVIMMSGRSKLMFWDNLGAATVNVILNLLLISHFGIIGAALSALISVLLLQVAYLVQTWKLERAYPFSRGLLKVFIAAGITLFILLVANSRISDVIVRFAVAIIGGAWMLFSLLLILGVEAEERYFLTRVLSKLGIYRKH